MNKKDLKNNLVDTDTNIETESMIIEILKISSHMRYLLTKCREENLPYDLAKNIDETLKKLEKFD